ncbi:MAG: hypothetical protein CVV52_07285 [Spirochaetae bacterium HGW-Spirochaetae-8]|jgi:hypothetical protein|nr:MAG: hypothetical protein CVV52_07285 [Spirochaetae bacterium HGW-Spirochaetae-8]
MRKLLTIVVLTVIMFNSCALFGNREHPGGAAQNPVVSSAEFTLVQQTSLMLAEVLFAQKVVVPSVKVEGVGSRAIARFDKLDLALVLLPDGMSLLDLGIREGFINRKIGQNATKGRVVLTGYLDQSNGRDLSVRLIVDGSDFLGRFLFELQLDTATGKWKAQINGVPYNS